MTVEYQGAPFCGWQWQPQRPSVQQTLQEALKSLTQEAVVLAAAGRTDTGVHATGQVVHMDLARPWDPHVLRRGLNFYLKDRAISVLDVTATDDQFHARFSATARAYTYVICHRPSPCVLAQEYSWWIPQTLNFDLMEQGTEILCGTHDFSAFRHKDCQSASAIKTLDHLHLRRHRSWLLIHARARSFLHRQVRMMVGALVHLGRGKWTPDDLRRVLLQGKCGPTPMTAPPHGLYLTAVEYPQDPRGSRRTHSLDLPWM